MRDATMDDEASRARGPHAAAGTPQERSSRVVPVCLLAALAGLLVGAAGARALGLGVGGMLPLDGGGWDWRGLAVAATGMVAGLKAALGIFAADDA